MRNILFTCTALTLLALAPIPQDAPKLAVGDQAPPPATLVAPCLVDSTTALTN